MAGKKGGSNTKKIAGNARKDEAAAQKQAVADAQAAAAADQEWSKGAKANAKKEAEAEKKAETARKKAERDALLAAEEISQPSTPKRANAKTAPKKSRGTLDISQLDAPTSTTTTTTTTNTAPALSATGIDNALDALSLTTDPNTQKMDRHPERRFKAAYAAFEARRLDEIAAEHPGLRKQQRIEICRKEFEKSEENPFNQAGVVGWDATKEDIREAREKVRSGVEARLGDKSP